MSQQPGILDLLPYYLRIMFLRFTRHVRAFGLPPWVLFIAFPLCFVLLHHFLFVRDPDLAPYIWCLLALGSLLQLNGEDRMSFLRQCFTPASLRAVRMTEGLLVSLPFAIMLFINAEILLAFLLLIAGAFISMSSRTFRVHFTIPSPFSRYPFEFTTGFRRFVLLIVAIYILSLIAISVNNFNLALFSLLSLGLISLSFYSKSEPLYYVWMHRFGARSFLWWKMRMAVRQLMILLSPMIALLLVMDLAQWWIVLLIVLACLLLLLMSLLGKYAYYPSEIPIMQGLAIGFCVLFPPLVLVVLPFFYSRAIQNCRKVLT